MLVSMNKIIFADRKNLCEEVVALRRQNRDLKRLLANYMDHGDIMAPPCSSQNQQFVHSTTPPYASTKKL